MEEQGAVQCPNCGSTEVRQEKISPMMFAVSVILLGFPLPFFRRRYHCFDCDHDFVVGKRKDTPLNLP